MQREFWYFEFFNAKNPRQYLSKCGKNPNTVSSLALLLEHAILKKNGIHYITGNRKGLKNQLDIIRYIADTNED